MERNIIVHLGNVPNEAEELMLHIFGKDDCFHWCTGVAICLGSIFNYLRHFIDHDTVQTCIDTGILPLCLLNEILDDFGLIP